MSGKLLAMSARQAAKSGATQSPAANPFDDEILTLKEAAQLLKLSKRTLYYLVENGKIPYLKAGRLLRFSRAALLAWLQSGVATGQ